MKIKRQMSWDGDPHFKECHDEVKFLHAWKPLTSCALGVRRGASVPSEGTRQQVLRRQNRETSPQGSFPTNPSQLRSCLHTSWASGAWVLRLRLPRLTPERGPALTAVKILWRYSWAIQGNAWASQTGKRSLLPRPSNSTCLPIAGSQLHEA